MSATAINVLDSQLDSEDAAAVLAAAWDVLEMTTGLCDAIAFDEGSDELQAMVAAQKCSEGRDLLPLPTTGGPVTAPPPEPGAAGLVPYVRLLEHVGGALARLAAGRSEAEAQGLGRAGELAAGAAAALAVVRGQ
ncbi:hypothetical protein ACFWBN_24515 [Streptomyces sp. NPDC059989]|uniref:hypothetical protein n=1 Tax=Streptomyces sp. NPDC059989 TaxID=3347026 RepID=UPI00368745B4